MRSILFAVLLTAALLAAAMPAPAAPAASFNASQKAELDRVSAALNAIKTLKGGFVQIDPNGGLEQGKFWLQKPGRVRFEYDPPSPMLIVANGTTVAVKNTKLNTLDRYPLISTPLDFVLSDTLNLADNPAVTSIAREGDSLILKARSQDAKVQGEISLVFSNAGLELRQWTVIDPQGQETTVALQNVEKDTSLKPSLFVLEEKNKFTKSGQ